MSTGNIVISRYLQRAVVRQRNSVTLAEWAASVTAEVIPTTPNLAFVRLRVVAESVPSQIDLYTAQTMTYFMQDPGTISNILQFISEDNDTTIEGTLATSNSAIVSAFMPRFAQSNISDAQVSAWCVQNNVPVPTS